MSEERTADGDAEVDRQSQVVSEYRRLLSNNCAKGKSIANNHTMQSGGYIELNTSVRVSSSL